jgi:predicted transcriptional regulator
MTTTTIRIEESLKARIAAAADRAGKTAHAFILDAISQTIDQAELDHEFQKIADARWKAIVVSGKTVPWEETKAYLVARSRGKNPRRPLARNSNS